MTSLRQLALKIPADFRKQIVEENIIHKAVVSAQDRYMLILHTVWATFVDPEGEHDLDCPYCLNTILQNFRGLQGELVALAKEDNLLDAV